MLKIKPVSLHRPMQPGMGRLLGAVLPWSTVTAARRPRASRNGKFRSLPLAGDAL